MKKTFILAAAVAMIAMTSCTKDFDCECKDGGMTYTYTLTDSKKSAAAAVCEGKGIGGYEVDGQSVDMGDDTNCSLK